MKNKYSIFILLACVVAVLASYFASSSPDGLEKVAEDLGFINVATGTQSLMTDYAIPFIPAPGLSTAVSGIIGIFICLGIFYFVRAIIPRPV